MFTPSRCPHPSCTYHRCPVPDFFSRQGHYRPKCRSHSVERFLCRGCGGGFSRQTFRADYRQRKPHLNATFFHLMIHCVSQRQAALALGVARRTIEHRFAWLCHHAELFHRKHLERASLSGPFQLDELETFEGNRFQPLTVPVLIDRSTFFLVATGVAPLRRKGKLSKRQREIREEHEARHGRRPSESARIVRSVMKTLLPIVPTSSAVVIDTDRKPSYQRIGKELFGSRFVGRTHDAKRRRDVRNPLFPINHTNARLRYFLSRLKRRTWCVSKKAECLAGHLAIATVWNNYARGITNKTRTTPAEALGVAPKPYRAEEILAWRPDFEETEAA